MEFAKEHVPSLLKNLLKELDYLQTVFISSHMETLKLAASHSIQIYRGANASQLRIGIRQQTPKGQTMQLEGEPVKRRGRPKATKDKEIVVDKC
jgi:hypothetical protein